jgi:hypothetical protein
MRSECQCKRDLVYSIRPIDSKCICVPSNEKLVNILEHTLGLSDLVDIDHCYKLFPEKYVEPQYKLLQNIKFHNVDLYLHAGPMLDIRATHTRSFPGDQMDDTGSVETNSEGLLHGSNRCVISVVDILHHVEAPEQLIDTLLARADNETYLIIIDHDCECWEDAYYLDGIHYGISLSGKLYLPTFGYRGRVYWKEYLSSRGYRDVYSSTYPDQYKGYIDIYSK